MAKNNGDRFARDEGRRVGHSVRRVFIFAYDKASIVEREQSLAENGYQVIVSHHLLSALADIRKKAAEIDFLVIGYAVPEEERVQLAKLYKHRHMRGQVIFLYKNKIKNANPPAAALLSVHGARDNLLTAIRTAEQPRTPGEIDPAGIKSANNRRGQQKGRGRDV